MLLSSTHLMPVIGLDFHLSTTGNPFHPYIGLVIDPADYIPFLGSTVHINGLKRGASDTSGIIIPLIHIPIVGGFVLAPIIGHESMNFFASVNVFAEGSRLSPKGYLVATCNDVGLPLSMTIGKTKIGKKKLPFAPTLFAPTAYSLPLSTGKPVFVGGPYVPDWGGMAKGLAASIGFSSLMKIGKTAVNHLLKRIKGANKLSRLLCKLGFEPVNLINGSVIYEGVDFSLPSPLPFSWERCYDSGSSYVGNLGYGVHTLSDMHIQMFEQDNCIGLLLEDGRACGFEYIQEGEESFSREEQLTLYREKGYFSVYNHRTHLQYTFDRFNEQKGIYQLSKIENLDGFSIRFEYDMSHRLTKIVDAVNREIIVSQTTNGYISRLSLRMPDGTLSPFVSYQYDELGHMVGITDALGKTTHIRYDNHRMIEKTDRNGTTFYWEYDKQGRCVHTWGDGGIQEGWIEYHPEKGYNLVKDANGAVTTYNYLPNQLVTSVVDPLGNTTQYDYTEYMELYREVDPEGRITGYHYDERGNKLGTTFPDGTKEYQCYNEENRPIISIDREGNKTLYLYDVKVPHRIKTIVDKEGERTKLSYTKEGLIAKVEKKDRYINLLYDEHYNLKEYQAQGQAIKWWEYDYLGRVIREKSPKIPSTHFTYDLLSRITKIHRYDENIIHFAYDNYDNVVQVKDKERCVKMTYTPMGSLLTREEDGKQVAFKYDLMEQLTEVLNERGNNYRFLRNIVGQVTTEIGFDNIKRQYQYNRSGDLVGILRPEGRFTSFQVDAFGKVSRAEYHDGTWEEFAYNKRGELISAKNPNCTISLKRDINGQIVTEKQLLPHDERAKQAITLDSSYNPFGERVHLTSSLGADINTQYSALGLVDSLTAHHQSEQNNDEWSSQINYDEAGREIERFATGGISIRTGYDVFGSVSGHHIYRGNELKGLRSYYWQINDKLCSLQSHLTRDPIFFSYDAIGNLVSQSTNSAREQLFKMPDILGNVYRDRATKDRQYGRGGELLKDEEYYYRYDCEGNLILKSKRNIHTPPPPPVYENWVDKLFQTKRVSKKEMEAHFQWQEGDTAYEWYANGMLKSVRNPDDSWARFEYDALGRRTAKITPKTIYRYVWDGNVLLHEWHYDKQERPQVQSDELGVRSYDKQEPHTNMVTWVYDGGSFIPVAKLTEEERYTIVQDYLGTPIQALNSKGEVVWDCLLDIYGEVSVLRGERGFIPFRYQGQYEDEETGLYYNRFRYYSPQIGNYISQDPIGLAGNNPTLYGYVSDTNWWVDIYGLKGNPILFNSNFYNQVKNISRKTNLNVKGANIFELTKNTKINGFGLKKGDLFHIDTLHLNEIELYNSLGKHKAVLDMDGNKIGNGIEGRICK